MTAMSSFGWGPVMSRVELAMKSSFGDEREWLTVDQFEKLVLGVVGVV